MEDRGAAGPAVADAILGLIFLGKEFSVSQSSTGRLVILLLFAATRLALIPAHQRATTLAEINVEYAAEAQRAARQGLSFYRLHEENRKRQDPQASVVERSVEYPPLSILWMRAPVGFLGDVPLSGPVPEAYVRSAVLANKILLLAVDACGFALLAAMGAGAAQLAVYTLGGLLLFPVLYDRLDLVLGVLLLVALLLLTRSRRYWLALVVLALAINFKMTPLVLVPLFVLGALPSGALARPVGGQTWKQLGRNLIVLGLSGAAVFLPFYLLYGPETLSFLGYHAKRGLEIGSVWNTLPIWLGAIFRLPVSASLRFGAVEINSPLAAPFRVLASIFTAAVIPGLAIALWFLLARRPVSAMRREAVTLAQSDPEFFARCASLCLLTAIVFAPVLSPQYLLWLVPLAPLWSGRSRWWAWWAFLTICALSTVHYPFFTGNVLGALTVEDHMPLLARLFWTAPLIARNLLLIGFTGWFWVDTVRRDTARQEHVEQRT